MSNEEKILIVDDDKIFLTYIRRKLNEKFSILTADSGLHGLDLLESDGPFALAVVDYFMPEMNGVEFLEKVREKYPDTVRMILTGATDLQSVMEIVNNTNVFRFINKPCSHEVLGTVLEKGLEQYRLIQSEKQKKEEVVIAYKQMIHYAKALNETVASLKNKNRELNEAYYDTIKRLVIASEYKDEDTYDHIIRMSRYSAFLAEKLNLSREEVENILFASPMHDVGKIGIPDAIIMKPARLTDEEFEQIKNHTVFGAKILAGSKAEILELARVIAISHHERWDGTGYPYGIGGEDIPLVGRIVALADTFDALTSRRPYKDAYPVDVAYDIIRKERGRQLDPDIVDIFINNYDEFIKIKEEVNYSDKEMINSFTRSQRDEITGSDE